MAPITEVGLLAMAGGKRTPVEVRRGYISTEYGHAGIHFAP